MNLNSCDWKKKKDADSSSVCIDVRTIEEFNDGHIQSSINVDFYDSAKFVSFLNELDKKSHIMSIADLEKGVILRVKS